MITFSLEINRNDDVTIKRLTSRLCGAAGNDRLGRGKTEPVPAAVLLKNDGPWIYRGRVGYIWNIRSTKELNNE